MGQFGEGLRDRIAFRGTRFERITGVGELANCPHRSRKRCRGGQPISGCQVGPVGKRAPGKVMSCGGSLG